CRSQQNIVFLKTHKTGSSTLTNILNRFADINNLRMLLPRGVAHRFSWPSIFSGYYVEENYLDKRNNFKANLLVNHARLNKSRMSNFFPKDVKFITIIRNPITNVESVYNYEEMGQTFQKYEHRKSKVEFKEFFESPMKFQQKAIKKNDKIVPLLHNGMLFDLGKPFFSQMEYEDTLIQQKIQELENEMDMFLIMEHFDESLILMKRLFCWTFEDILYIKHNQRHKVKAKMDPKLKETITKWNRADLLLYQHFNKTLWRKIAEYGKSFHDDLKIFRNKLDQFKDACDVKETKGGAHDHKDTAIIKHKPGENVNTVLVSVCEMVFRSETNYINWFRRLYSQEIQEIRQAIFRKMAKARAELERKKQKHNG
uniref:Uncharacterized protein n=1 Tax=Clytia hemisphaerica TaxID=252671 RepID=A0A7M5UTH3_9CNID